MIKLQPTSTTPSLCTLAVHELLPNTWLKSVIKASRALLSCAALGLFLAAAVSPTSVSAAATGAPGTPSLTPSDYNGTNSVAIIMNMWWGNNGTSWQLYQNGTLVYSANLTDNSPNAQTATSATISNLALGTYSFTAKLINSFGTTTSSALSYTVTQAGGGTGPTIPATPTGLTATVNSSSQITVTWTASSGATSYDLQVDGTVHTGVTSPYVSSGLASNSSHTYSVRADNSAGDSAYSSSVSATTQTAGSAPATPTGLTATVNSSSQITVTWTASSGATSYDLQVDGTVHTGVTSPYVSSGLASNSSHTYSVRADNSVGDSAYSSSVSATTQTAGSAPATPTGLTATVNSSSQITVTWTASSGATSYDLQVDGTVHTGATSPYVSSGLASNSSHTYSVRADNSVGDSAYSSSVSATTQSGSTSYPAWAVGVSYTVGEIVSYNGNNYICIQPNVSEAGWDPVDVPALWSLYSGGSTGSAPSTPTGLSATPNSTSQITVTWNASSGATSYDLQVDGVVHSGVTSPFINTGLATSSSHTYSVRADNSVGDSAYSSSVSATTEGNSSTAPSTPTGLAATANSTSQITVTWNASSGATSYDLQVDGVVHSGVTSPFADTGLATASSHTYSVRADNSVGDSSYSSSVSATTQSGTTNNTLPEHLITGYYQDFTNGATVLTVAQVPSTYNLIAVAFATATTTAGQVTFSVDPGLSSALGGYTQAQMTADIATCKARGQHVILSVGGQNGTISVTDSASASAFASSVNSIMATWGFEGVDIDLENGINVTYMAQALREITSGSIITLAPQTIDVQSSGSDYLALALSIKDILTICNCQYYNSGTMLGANGQVYAEGTEDFLTALAVIQLQAGLAPSQVGLGLPASSSAAGSGYVSPSVVVDALECLATGQNPGTYHPPTTYPTIRGAMTWSINWDAANGYQFANTVSASFGSL